MNVLIATFICAVVNAIYTLYVSSTVFKKQVASWGGEDTGRIEAFFRVAEVTEGFWSHIIEGWTPSFGLSLISCLLLLTLMRRQSHKKK